MQSVTTWVPLAILVAAGAAWSAEPASDSASGSEAVALEVFKAPRTISMTPPKYPFSERADGKDGWVQLNFMIDKQGKPYEIGVVESTGNKVLEEKAVKAAEEWRFVPAMLGETPVESGINIKVTFRLTDNDGARTSFVDSYKKLLKAIDGGDRARADQELAKLDAENLYEDAFKHLATYQYHVKWGSEAQQLAALKRAIAYEDKPRYLNKEQLVSAFQQLLRLDIRAQDFGDALLTWKKLQALAPKEIIERWRAAVDKIDAMRTDGSAYRISAEMTHSSWFYQLFKQRFQIAVASGALSEIKLRCDKKYVFFRFDPELEYKVDDKYGECEMELVGEPGTKFSLVQS